MKRGLETLSEAHVLVTGGARGIGLATARRLLRAGARVTLWDRDRDALVEAMRALGLPTGRTTEGETALHTEVCDITDFEALSSCLERSEAVLGPVDVLVNNAGHLAPGQFEEQPPEVWMRSLEVNVNAVVYLTRLVLPGMYERGRGHVVNISSAAGTIGVPGLAVYSAAKWAVWGFSEALRGEAWNRGVMVSSIHPSYVARGMFAGAELHGLGRFIVPLLNDHDVVAEAIVESALKRKRFSPKRPRSVRIAVLLRGVLPDPWFNWVVKHLGVWESMTGWRGRGA